MEIVVLGVVLLVIVVIVSNIPQWGRNNEFREMIEQENSLRADISRIRSEILNVQEKIQDIRLKQNESQRQ